MADNLKMADNGKVSAHARTLNAYTLLIVGVSVVAGMSFGLDTGSTGAAMEMAGFRQEIGWPAKPENLPTCGPDAYMDPSSLTSKKGFIVSVFHAGAMVGAPLGGELSDRFGRRITILLACLLFIAGAMWQTFAGFTQPGCGDCLYRDMLLGRLVGGIGLGFMLTTVPVFVSEMAPAQLRGMINSSFQFAVNVGILVCALFESLVEGERNGWRYTLALQAIPAFIVAFSTIFFLPESPRFLVKKGCDTEALGVLERLAGTVPNAKEIAAAELREIQDELSQIEAAGSLSWADVFRGPALTALLCGVGVTSGQNVTGINYFVQFGPSIVQNFCFSPWIGNIALSAVNLVASGMASFVCDRFGRKKLLLVGAYVMSASFLLNSIVFTVVPDINNNKPAGIFILVMVLIFMAAFGLSWGPMGWLVPSEIFPLNMRGKGMGLAVTANMIASILFGDYGPGWLSSPDVLGVTGTWWLLTFFNFAYVLPIAIYLLPETKMLTLEEIAKAFNYQFGGLPDDRSRSMLGFCKKNAQQAKDMTLCRKADVRAGFDVQRKADTAA